MSNNDHVAFPVHNGEVRCFRHTDVALVRQVSQTQNNFNRAFYSCEVIEGEGGEICNFFKWEDELALASPPPSQVAPRKRPAPTTEHELSPAQKRSSGSQWTTPRTPASQARLDAILRATGQRPDASTSSTPASPSPSSSRSIGIPQTARPTSSLGSAQVSTPLYRPITPPPTAEGTELHSPLQTLPSSRVLAPVARSEHANGTRRNANSSLPSRSLLDADARLEADPFSSPSGSFTGSGLQSRGAVAYNFLPSAAAGELSPAVREFVDNSNRTAGLIADLERRLTAAEKSNDAKARKMEKLLEQIKTYDISHSKLASQNSSRALASERASTVIFPSHFSIALSRFDLAPGRRHPATF
ncbi:hypothetical protein DFH07DRAFT_937548 [Mycena maculata]|uniref:GRF-type domain-containing protein n=1 Tax=Mycena maculata TaxID=230809 RepID=A0AAD7JXI1_9AGAR|nr:hypothetical protein DFH07DRAFT_937548 [Mycena maculata]